MDNRTQSSHSDNSKALDKFFEACLNADIKEDSKITVIDLPEFDKELDNDGNEDEVISVKKSVAWKKAEDMLKDSFNDMHSRLGEINKGLHNNSKISELIVELVTVDTVRQILSGKIKDLKGNEAAINIHPGIAKQHWAKLRPGTVLILKNVTVFSPSDNTHCLIVLKDNIMNILSNH